MTVPRRLPLEYELLHGQLGRVLLLHDTDRWYLGDFLRHTSWVTCLADEVGEAAQPRELTLATHSGYLPLFATDARVDRLCDAREAATTADLGRYDLVVVPSTLPPPAFRPDVTRGLYSWNDGWAYTRHGAVIASGAKTGLNYFTAALHRHGQTALPTATPVRLALPERARHRTARAVHQAFGDDRPVIVYNPTASNPVTRQSSAVKEVENVLTEAEHTALLAGLRRRLPGCNVLIGSALVPGDEDNRRRITGLQDTVGDPAVRSILQLQDAGLPESEVTTLRGFAVLLASDAVAASVGTGTGTNTHLAAMVGLPSFSVERGADAGMIANWDRAGELPMGSFRWRNPSPLVGAYNLDWHRKTRDDFDAIADAAAAHLTAHTAGVHTLLTPADPGSISASGPGTALTTDADARLQAGVVLALLDGPTGLLLRAAARFAGTLRPDVRGWLTDFTDELAYLQRRPGFGAVTNERDLMHLPEQVLLGQGPLIADLFRDSMFHKIAQLAASAPPPASSPAKPTPGGPAGCGPDGPDGVAARRVPVASVLRRVRAGAPLTTAELARVQVADEHELAGRLRDATAEYATALRRRPTGEPVRFGWQHAVHLGPDTVVKTLATNPASEYLTDEFTLAAVADALHGAGGLVPPSSQLIDQGFVSARLMMLVHPGTDRMSPPFGGRPIPETVLPAGWLDEQIRLQLRLLRQGVLNFDTKLKDLGVDEHGVLQIADFSAFQLLIRYRPGGPRTDMFRLAVNELIRNGQYLARFANGDQLHERWIRLVRRHLGLNLRPHVDGWQWGDQADPRITPLARRLHRLAHRYARGARPRPVHPVFDPITERIAFDTLAALAVAGAKRPTGSHVGADHHAST